MGVIDKISIKNAIETPAWLAVWAAEPDRRIDVRMSYNDLKTLCDLINEKRSDRWIPVEEKFPESEKEVFVTTDTGEVLPAIYEDGTVRENDSAWLWYDLDGDWDYKADCMIIPEGWFENRKFNPEDTLNTEVYEKVIAWRYLPNPYHP